jgi:hypothetical protein
LDSITSTKEMISTGEITTPQTVGETSNELSSEETISSVLSSAAQVTIEESNMMSTFSAIKNDINRRRKFL